MQFLGPVLVLMIPVLAYAVVAKFAAFLMRSAHMRWQHALIYSLAVFVIAMIAELVVVGVPLKTQEQLAVATKVIWFLVGVAFGGWYFQQRVTSKAGEAFSLASGLKLGTLIQILIPTIQFIFRQSLLWLRGLG